MSNQNNKKALAEKLKNYLNSPEYVTIPDLIKKNNDCSPSLTFSDGEHIVRRRKFIDFEKELDLIYYDQLEPTDWTEITKLIEKRNQERQQNYQAKKKKIEDKVNSRPGLFYYYGSGSKNERSNSILSYGDKQGRYFGLWGSENGRSFYLEINSKHPVLDTFPFGKHGYYLIETDKPIERNDGIVRPWSSGGENNASNFHKWVEVGDKITITPYQVENGSELPENLEKELKLPKGKYVGCDTCQKKLGSDYGGSDNFYIIKRYHGIVNIGSPVIWACQDCYPTKEQEYLQNYETVWERYLDQNNEVDYRQIKFSFIDCYSNQKDSNGKVLQQQNCRHCQPWKNHEAENKPIAKPSDQEIAKYLLQYFQDNDIKKIKLVNGELVIEYNNKNFSATEKNNSQELQLVKNIIQKSNNRELSLERLKEMVNTNSTQTITPNNNKAILMVVV